MPRIHPSATVHPDAELADDVEVGPYCLVEQDVTIGPGTRLRNHATIRRYTTLGANNVVDGYCTFGGEPQDVKFDPAGVSYLRIGDDNCFREGVTLSRGTGAGTATTVGNRTYWMAQSHAGHNVVVGDEAIFVNGAAVGGHATIGRGAFLSAHCAVHQFCWIGEMAITEGNAAIRSHVPPYTMVVGRNFLAGLNVVGLRRAKDLTDEDRRQIKEAFRITYRSNLKPPEALAKMDLCTGWGEAAGKFRDFIRRVLAAEDPYRRGLVPSRVRAGGN